MTRRHQRDPLGCGEVAGISDDSVTAGEIYVLRNWRDDFLAESYLGQKFIKMYYSLSPPVANNINNSETKKRIVRITLNPILKILEGNYYK